MALFSCHAVCSLEGADAENTRFPHSNPQKEVQECRQMLSNFMILFLGMQERPRGQYHSAIRIDDHNQVLSALPASLITAQLEKTQCTINVSAPFCKWILFINMSPILPRARTIERRLLRK